MNQIIRLVVITLFILASTATAQEYFRYLNGFGLKQYREVATNELGKPSKSAKFDDGVEYEIFSLKPDNSAYMVFEYAADETDLIWSIQISGVDESVDPSFRDLKFGMSAAQVEKMLGKPTKKVNIGEYGFRWEYDKSNFSIEMNLRGRLASIKITDDSDIVFPKVDAKKIPSFLNVSQVLASKNNADIAKLLAPDMEIYRGNETIFFGRSIKSELATDYSKIFAEVRKVGEELKKVNTKNSSEYEENMRVTLGQNVKHVMKFKNSAILSEIVFKYEWGEFVIWEIKLK